MSKRKSKCVYDYIVVGSGPGGSAVSQVLTSCCQNKVLMLEAGEDKDDNPFIRDSRFALTLEEDHFPEFFWPYSQTHQENVPEMEANYTNGRIQSGGTGVNGEQEIMGSKFVYDKWFEITNDPDWSAESMYNTFNSAVGNPISRRIAPLVPTQSADKFTQAVTQAAGLVEIEDYNNINTPFGPFKRWSYFQNPDGTRASSSTDIIKPILLNRSNFSLKTKSTAVKIVWKGNKVKGIKYLNKGKCKTAYAKNVIVSAGINTPLLLQLSGVGPKDLLNQLNIPVVSDVCTGCNLFNHLIIVTTFTKNPNDLPPEDPNTLYSFGALLPDLDNNTNKPRASEWIGIDNGDNKTITVAIIQLQPFSNGFAKIQSDDPLTVPIASEAALDDPRDLAFFIGMIREQLVPIAQKLNEIDPEYKLIQPDPLLVGSDEYLINYIKNNLQHSHHWQSQTLLSVVTNNDGSVKGTRNLYVSDNCLIPYTVDSNTAMTAYCIGYTVGRKLLRKTGCDGCCCSC